ncbi:MAG: hypothetical protein KAX44_04360, partial [Candidatus Brocadiae bacterium]|nr:hypothetical protein [Candidatus Brocadiia bacterium]
MARGKIIGSVSYQALEDAFAAELAEVANGPGGRTWVLVPTNLLALHLRREAARRIGGLLGVGFLTLKDAARRMAQPFLASGGRRPVPAGAIELVLQRLLDGVPDGSYFAAFRRFSNGAPAIERTFKLLQNCLWTPEALRQAIEIAEFRDPGAARRMRELAGIWADLEKWKQEKGLFDGDDLILAAGRDDVAPADHPQVLLIYGFYDLNPAQRALAGRLIATAERCTAFLLWDE